MFELREHTQYTLRTVATDSGQRTKGSSIASEFQVAVIDPYCIFQVGCPWLLEIGTVVA